MKGYKGREAVFEVMEADEGIRNLIAGGASDMEIERLAISGGMRTLRESCIAKVIEGTTTIEELIRTTY
jgi:type IV pilus assembly protein PilB